MSNCLKIRCCFFRKIKYHHEMSLLAYNSKALDSLFGLQKTTLKIIQFAGEKPSKNFAHNRTILLRLKVNKKQNDFSLKWYWISLGSKTQKLGSTDNCKIASCYCIAYFKLFSNLILIFVNHHDIGPKKQSFAFDDRFGRQLTRCPKFRRITYLPQFFSTI